MRVDNMIVFMDGMFPSILFPVGKPEDGGSCAYLTDYCRDYCPTQETNIHEVRALNFFKEQSEDVIVEKILEDVGFYSMMHLYWWSWGDCLPELTDKIANVMLKLSYLGLLQNGYTRNPMLWSKINLEFPQRENLRIGFHVDSMEEINNFAEDKVVCLPDTDVNKAELYLNGEKVARCCGIWCDWLPRNETRAADCQECYLFKQGCFIN